MTLSKEIIALLKKDVLLEWRQKYAFNGILLYLFSTIFVVYISVYEVSPVLWVALFWVIMLFASVNAVAKSFMQEGKGRTVYLYTLASPQAVILSKMIYNAAMMLVLSTLGLAMYSIVIGNPVVHPAYFILATLMGSVSFALTFTVMSAIASKASNNSTLMAILSFPLIIPVLLLLIKISQAAIFAGYESFPFKDLLVLGLLDIVMLLIAIILFPYLWKD